MHAFDLFAQLGGTPDSGGTWTDDDNSGALAGSTFDPGTAGNGTYSFTYQVDGTGPCTGQSVTAVVTVEVVTTSTAPIPDQPSYTGCAYSVPPTLNTPGVGIRWYSDMGLTNMVGTGNSFTPTGGINIDSTMIGSTLYYVTQDDGCGESPAAEVEVVLEGLTAEIGEVVNTYPEQNIGAIEVINFMSDDPPFRVKLEDVDGNIIYDWISLQEDRLGEYSYLFTLLPAADYVVWVEDDKGCTFPILQSIIFETELFIPNVFTPNGDNYNDYFKILNKSGTAQVRINNRWGVKVFESDDYQNDWQAENLPEGVYFYTVKMNGVVYNGNVEVWRHSGPTGGN
jgi:gliding motility-associated-like protein